MSQEFRGVGKIHPRKSIAAVVEVLRRQPGQGSKWDIVRPFTGGVPETAEYAFAIMTPTATKVVNTRPIREAHPSFVEFNSAHPAKCRMLRCRLVHWYETEAYEKFLGAWKAPPGKQSPTTGWWCQGNAVKARRWIDGKWCEITCPHRLCEYSLDKSGPKGVSTWCKPHSSLVFQLDWPEENKLLPRLICQWDSQSWNNIANLDGMFNEISGLASHFGYQGGQFPIIGLQFTLHLKERVKANRRFPEVSVSTEGDRMAWMKITHALAMNDQAKMLAMTEAPKLLGEAPPDGFKPDDMRDASEAALSPVYQPRNVRDAKRVHGAVVEESVPAVPPESLDIEGETQTGEEDL